MKKLITILCVLAMIVSLCACGGSEAPSAPAGDSAAGKVVGICQLVQHPALDAATQGFKDALVDKLGDDVSFIEQNASGDSATCATICSQLVSEEVDLILANATAALRAASAAKVLELSDKIVEENNLTTMMITHNMTDAIRHGNRLIMMNQGKIVFDISGEAKQRLTKQELVEMFSHSANIVENDAMMFS